jgi:hypothetical protein
MNEQSGLSPHGAHALPVRYKAERWPGGSASTSVLNGSLGPGLLFGRDSSACLEPEALKRVAEDMGLVYGTRG